MLMPQGDTGATQVNGAVQREGENMLGGAASIVGLMSNESTDSFALALLSRVLVRWRGPLYGTARVALTRH